MLRNTLQPLYTAPQVGLVGRIAWPCMCFAIVSERHMLTPLPHAPHVQIETALQAVGMRRDARAQDLSTEQFCELYRQLHAAVTAELEV